MIVQKRILACLRTLLDLVLEPGWDKYYEGFDERRCAVYQLKQLVGEYKVTAYIPPIFFSTIHLLVQREWGVSRAHEVINELLALGDANLNVEYERIIESANTLLTCSTFEEGFPSLELYEAMLIPLALALRVDMIIIQQPSLSNSLLSLSRERCLNFDIPILSLTDSLTYLSTEKFNAKAQDKIFVYTPTGTIKRLPRGSTPIDFAYAIHTSVGNSCSKAYVNGVEVPLTWILNSGDIVEIKKGDSLYPDPTWIEYVKTRNAKKAINKAIKKQWSAKGWQKINENFNVRIMRQSLEDVAESFNCVNINQLSERVGKGQITIEQLKEQLQKIALDPSSGSIKIKPRETQACNNFNNNLPLLKLSICCTPLPQDEVIGILSVNDNVIRVHRKDCPNISNLSSDKLTEICWDCEQCYIDLFVAMRDHPGTIRNILNRLADENLMPDLRNVYTSKDGRARANLAIAVKSRSHLNTVLNLVEHMPNVERVKVKKIHPI